MSRLLSAVLVLGLASAAYLIVASPPARPEEGKLQDAGKNQEKEAGGTPALLTEPPPPSGPPGFPGDGGPGMPGPGPGFGRPPFPLLLALDGDEDGEISAAEIENAVEALKKVDKNNDGKLSGEELLPQFGFPGGGTGVPDQPGFGPRPTSGRGSGFRVPPLPLMSALDADSNEEISAAEMKDAVAALKKLDKNNDGKLSGEESLPQFGGPGGFGPRGGPGGFGPPGGSQGTKLVVKFDADGDGRLNDKERAAARAAAREQGRGGFGPFGRQPAAPKPDTEAPAQKLTPPTTGVIAPNTDLYDANTLRTLYLQFADPDWYGELGDFYRTDVEVPADLIVDGVTHPGVGVHFRGNTSYMMSGQSQKKPFNISLDFTDQDERLYGYRTLNLHNSHEDPSFLREVLFSRICREYTPALDANFVKLVVNGENWGAYANVQQFNRDFLQDWFDTGRGFRWKVGMGFGSASALDWLGTDPAAYKQAYEIKSADEPEAWAALIKLCETLNKTPDDKLEGSLNAILNVDQALWLIALENIFIDEGYVTRGADYALYTDGRYGRFHLLSIDNNETLTYGGGPFFGLRISGAELDPLALADDNSRPVIHRLLSIPHLRARYLAHVRTIVNESLNWDKLAPIVESYQKLIAEEVKADTKKLYSYEAFIKAHVEDSAREGGGPFGGGPPGGGPFGGWPPGQGPQQQGAPAGGAPGQATPGQEQPFGAEGMLRRFDANGDGTISKDEVPEQAQRFIQDFDRNGDGVVTKEELPQGDFGMPGGGRRGGGRPGRGPGGGGGPGGGATPSLKRFVEERREYILGRPEMSKPWPQIQEVSHRVKDRPSADSPEPLPTESVRVTAKVSGEAQVDSVILYYAESRWAPFDQAIMFDDGAHEDGKAEDGLYSGDIRPFPAGTQVHYYVEARSPASVGTTAFYPSRAEFSALTYKVAMPVASTSAIVINELMASNHTAMRDPQGRYDDWIELLNISEQEVDLSGMYLTDKKDNPRKWAFPKGTTLGPGAYIIVWADEEGHANPGLHANFKLGKDGETVMLIDADARGNAMLDSVTFGKQRDDAAFGRLPDGKGAFRTLQATPGGTNKAQ